MNDCFTAQITSALIFPKTGTDPETAYLFQGTFAKRYTKKADNTWQAHEATRLGLIWPTSADTAGKQPYRAAYTYKDNIWMIQNTSVTSFRPEGAAAQKTTTDKVFPNMKDTGFRDSITAAAALSDTEILIFSNNNYLCYNARKGQPTTSPAELTGAPAPDAACWIPGTRTIHLFCGATHYTYELTDDHALTRTSGPDATTNTWPDAPLGRPVLTFYPYSARGSAGMWPQISNYDLSIGRSASWTSQQTYIGIKGVTPLGVMFSPHNEHLYFRNLGPSPEFDLYSMDTTGKFAGKVKTAHGSGDVVDISPDGQRLLMQIHTEDDRDVWLSLSSQAVDQSLPPELRNDVIVFDQPYGTQYGSHWVRWSRWPEKKDVIYLFNRSTFEFVEMSADGQRVVYRKIEQPPRGACYAQYISPDGKWVYFHLSSGPSPWGNLMRFDLQMEEWTPEGYQLLDKRDYVVASALTPDSKKLCTLADDSFIVVMDPNQPEESWSIKGPEFDPNRFEPQIWADPSGDYFYVMYYQDPPNVWKIDANHRSAEPVEKLSFEDPEYMGSLGWSWTTPATEHRP
ncbi:MULTISPECIES: hypothetical protein [unclassified Streptomyces]|uniref:hypothetical protein n=1 Tax=unclassified Streptomyces TaxID=2593676 RepID=UPI00371CBA2F